MLKITGYHYYFLLVVGYYGAVHVVLHYTLKPVQCTFASRVGLGMGVTTFLSLGPLSHFAPIPSTTSSTYANLQSQMPMNTSYTVLRSPYYKDLLTIDPMGTFPILSKPIPGTIYAPSINDLEEDIKEKVQRQYIPKMTKVHWYPRYMAKATKSLRDALKLVDFLIYVQDARIPSSSYPTFLETLQIPPKPAIRVFTHFDLSSDEGNKDWGNYYRIRSNNDFRMEHGADRAENSHRFPTPILFTNAQKGDKGIILIHKAAVKICQYIQERRLRKGLLERPLRGAVLGYPNVGKSALINRLLKMRKCISYDMPGVTQNIQWARLNKYEVKGPLYKQLDMLDTPGLFPSVIEDQLSAYILCACNAIPEGNYDVEVAAENLLGTLFQVWKQRPKYIPLKTLKNRYGVDPLYHGVTSWKFSGEFYLEELSVKNHHGNAHAAAQRVLVDFRKGYMGRMTLEIPPHTIAKNAFNDQKERGE